MNDLFGENGNDFAISGLYRSKDGFIAGNAPGIVTKEGVPASANVECRERSSRTKIDVVNSTDDGVYLFHDLDPVYEYDLIARDQSRTYRDVVIPAVKPYSKAPVVSLVLSAGVVGVPYSASVEVTESTAPFTFAKVNGPSWMIVNATTGMITGTPDSEYFGLVYISVTGDGRITTKSANLSITDTLYTDPHFNQVTALLHFDNSYEPTKFLDVIGNPWTAQGGAKQTSAVSKFGGASADFTAGQSIYSGVAAAFGFGAGDYTIEGWNRAETSAGGWGSVFDNRENLAVGISIYLKNSSNLRKINVYTNAASIGETSSGFTLGVQEHWAVTRSGTTVRAFINGVKLLTATDARTLASMAACTIGTNSSAQPTNAYCDEFRITKGVARYTENFAPPTGPFPNSLGTGVDPYFSSVNALLHMNGTDASTTFTDMTGKVWTANGNAQIDTAQSKFGSASGLFDGTGDYIDTPDSTDFYLPGDFTLEMFFRTPSLAAVQELCGQGDASTVRGCVEIRTNGAVWFYATGATAVLQSAASAVAINTWYHIAVTRSGNSYTLWINGASAATATSATVIDDYAGAFSIGRVGQYNALYTNGWIDDFRLTKGVARYAAAFTIPTFAHPDIGNLSASFSSLPTAYEGVAYTGDANAVGGTGGHTFSLITAPAWASINSSTGAITGTPGVADVGTNSITVRAKDSVGNPFDISAEFIVVATSIDPQFPNVVALLHTDGTDGSTTFTDVSGKTWTAYGNAQIDTAQSKFGGASGLFDGTGDYIDSADSVDFYLPGDMTVEMFVRTSSLAARQFLCGQGTVAADDSRCFIEIATDGSVKFYGHGTSPYMISATGAIVVNTWYHIAVTRSANLYTLWINGASAATATNATTITDFAGAFSVGRLGIYDGLYTNGWIDDFRLTKGIARYTTAFPIPAFAHPNVGYGQALFHFDPADYAGSVPTMTNTSKTAENQSSSRNTQLRGNVGKSSNRYKFEVVINTRSLNIGDQIGIGVCANDFDLTTGARFFLDDAVNSAGISLGRPNTWTMWSGGASVSTAPGAAPTFDPGDVFTIFFVSDFTATTSLIRVYRNSSFVAETTWVHNSKTYEPCVWLRGQSGTKNKVSLRTLESEFTQIDPGFPWSDFDPATDSLDPTLFNNVLHCHFNGANASTTLTDSSWRSKNLTAVGNAQLSTSDPKFGTAAIALDGTGDYANGEDDPLFSGVNAFTVSGWIKPTGVTTIKNLFGKKPSGSAREWNVNTTVASKVVVTAWNSSGTAVATITGVISLVAGVKTHIEVSRSGAGLWRLFVDGVADGSATESAAVGTTTQAFILGRDPADVARDFAGQIDELRFKSMIVEHTANFTPPAIEHSDNWLIVTSFSSLPNAIKDVAYTGDVDASGGFGAYTFALDTAPAWMSINSSTGAITGTPGSGSLGTGITVTARATDSAGNFDTISSTIYVTDQIDPHFYEKVSTSLHMNGTDASTTFTDASGKVWTAYGNAQIDTAQIKFGSASGLFDGNGDYISTGGNSGFLLGTGDFTIEAHIRPADVTLAYRCIMSDLLYSSSGGFSVYQNGLAVEIWKGGTTTAMIMASPSLLKLNTWTHVAWTRQGNVHRLFMDGVLVVSATDSVNFTDSRFQVGRNAFTYYNGHIDDVRFTKGVARYTASFMPITFEHPDVGPTYASFSSLPTAVKDVAYTGDVNGAGGSGGYTFALDTAPGWMSINSSTGALTGTPLVADVGNGITIVARATDSLGVYDTVTTTFNVLASAPAALSTTDKSANITLSNNDRTYETAVAAWTNAQSTSTKTTGKHYAEMIMVVKPSYSTMLGICISSHSTEQYVGQTTNGWSVYASGADTVVTYTQGGLITRTGHDVDVDNGYFKMAVDIDAGKVWFGTNAGWFGGGDPAAGTTPTYTFTAGTSLQIAGSAYNSAKGTINFGNEAFLGTVPSGFTHGWLV